MELGIGKWWSSAWWAHGNELGRGERRHCWGRARKRMKKSTKCESFGWAWMGVRVFDSLIWFQNPPAQSENK
ncbi:hypothetical protein GOBAR_DD20928 [Gossypium barbadense]|nr:hypothetical protein GOBAR_DD20928 [Gossypium barbadense]